MKTESYEQFWERRKLECERGREIAIGNLRRIALQSQLQLFNTDGVVIPFPVRELGGDAA